MRPQLRRLVSSGVAIVLGVAFITATLILGATLNKSMVDAVSAGMGDADVMVTAEKRPITQAEVDKIKALPDVKDVRTSVTGVVGIDIGTRQTHTDVYDVPTLSDKTKLTEGRLPEHPGEVAINTSAANNWKLGVGQSVTLMPFSEAKPSSVSIVGIMKLGADVTMQTSANGVIGLLSDVQAWTGQEDSFSYAAVTSDADAVQLRDAIKGLTDDKIAVRTAADEQQERIDSWTSGADTIRNLLLGFGAIAFFVAALVISNTFAIVVAQRTRQFALLRCIGATRGQVFGAVLREAVALALVSSAVGVLLGIGVGAIVSPMLGSVLVSDEKLHMALTWGSIVWPIVLALVVTVLSAVVPARKATQVRPIAALRPQTAGVAKRRGNVIQLIAGLMLLIAGGIALYYGGTKQVLLAGIAGGFASFIGVLALGGWLVPGFVGSLRGPLGALGVPGELAVSNARRNPSRSASTASALLIATTLISMLVVGAATGQKTVEVAMNNEFPADASVMAAESLNDSTMDKLKRVDGVSGVAELWIAQATVGNEGHERRVMGQGPDAASVLRKPALLDRLDASTVLVSKDTKVDGNTLTEGQMLTIKGDLGSLTLRVAISDFGAPTVTTENLKKISSSAERNAWLRIDDKADAVSVIDNANEAVSDIPGAQVEGPAVMRQMVQKAIDAVLMVTIALLGIAVVISFVGVGNTLGLGIHERTQELGLLRALGLTRSQVKTMVGLEGVTMGLYAMVVGIGLGIAYGVAGVGALLAKDVPVVVALPWGRLALIALFIVLAAWLASIIPARRAARVSPTRALAAE